MIPVKPHIAAKAHVKSMEQYREMYRRSIEQPEEFWREQAAILDWYHPPSSILDAEPKEVDFAWYSGGRLNACYNCVDRHLAAHGDKTAILWVGDEPGEYRGITPCTRWSSPASPPSRCADASSTPAARW